jgi:hypothetical protein
MSENDYSRRYSADDGTPIESTARSLGIAPENLENQTISDFVHVLKDASQLQNNLARMAHDPGARMLDTLDPGGWMEPIEDRERPDLRKTYQVGELMMRAVIHVIQHGGTGLNIDPDYIKGKLNAAVAAYGLKVVRADEFPKSGPETLGE